MANTLKFGNGEWYGKEGTILAYNDENNNYKPLPFNFTRASTATFVNKDGLIETVGFGEPRVDYLNDSNGALLLEPSRTNQLIGSSTSGFVLTRSARGDRDFKLGIVDGYEYSFTSANPNINYIYSENTLGYKTFSVFIDSTNSDYFNIRLCADGGSTYGAYVTFTPSTQSFGSITENATYVRNSSVGYDYFGDNIYRIWITTEFIFYSGGTTFPIVYFGDNSNVWIGGAQIELGSYATSYIPTSGSAVTRAAETSYGAGNAQVINSTEGVLYAELKPITDNYVDGSGTAISSQLNLSDGNLNNGVTIRFRGTILGCLYYNGSSYQAVLYYNDISASETYKVAFLYKQNDFKMYVNGVLIASDTSGSMGSFTLNRITFDNSNGVNPFYGKVKNVQVYNQALSDSQLKSLTS